MFNVCQGCGEYRADKEIDPSGPYAVCPVCGHARPFQRLPLFSVTGPSGAGKTAVCTHLVHTTDKVIVLESDILWREEFDDPQRGLAYRNTWLRVCKNVHQAGRPVLLCGSVTPGQFESCVEARYFSAFHYLALVCDDEVLASRLRARPAWRRSSIEPHQEWNRWFKETEHEADVTLLDTTDESVDDTARGVLDWVRTKWTAET